MHNFNTNDDKLIEQSLLASSSSSQQQDGKQSRAAAAASTATVTPKGEIECKSRDIHGPQRKMTRLPGGFTPDEFDVICSRGGAAKSHIGNHNFRQKVADLAQSYADAKSKVVKSSLVNSILEWVHTKSPDGGFVKQIDGVWYQVGDDIAREKVGQALREMNHGKYKSSMKAKRRRWKQEKQQQQTNRDDTSALNAMLKNHNEAVEARLNTMGGRKGPDDQVLNLFTQQNSSLLASFKSDEKVKEQINKLG